MTLHESAPIDLNISEIGHEFLAERKWWRNVLGPANWRGRFVVSQGSIYASKDKLSKYKLELINKKISEALEKGAAVIISADHVTTVLSGESNILVFLSAEQADKVISGPGSRAVPALKGKPEAKVSGNTRGEISSITYTVDGLPITQFLNPADPPVVPAIYIVENPQSTSKHMATLLLDEFRRNKKIVLKQTA